MKKQRVGLLGENYASQYLAENGFELLKRNFRLGKFGEIDIIAKERDCFCFIEVKTRTGNKFGRPSEAVNIKKQEKIKMLASIYLKNKGFLNKELRFDIIEVFLKYCPPDQELALSEINLIRNAF